MDRATNVMLWDESEQDRHGDEYQIWYVQLGDDDGKPIGIAYKHTSRNYAITTAQNISRDRQLPVEMGW